MRERKQDAIALMMAQGGWYQEPIAKGYMDIVWEVTDHRVRDFDNLLPEIKPYTDALKTIGVILDDSAIRFGLGLQYVISPELEEPVVRIFVSEG